MLRKIIFLSILFLFLVPVISFSDDYTQDQYDSYQWFLKGKFLFNQEKYVEAYSALKKAAEIDPENKKAIDLIQKIEDIAEIQKIKVKEEIEKIRDASEKIKQELPKPEVIVEKKEYAWDEFHFKLAERYMGESQYDKAIEEFQRSLEVFPDNVLAHYYLFLIFRTRKQYDKALDKVDDISVFTRPYAIWQDMKNKGEDTQNISKVIAELEPYFKYFPGQDFLKKFSDEMRCMIYEMEVESAYEKDKDFSSVRKFLDRSFNYRIIKELDYFKEPFPEFSVSSLFARGLLKKEYKCPAGGEYFVKNGRVYCSKCDLENLDKQEEKIKEDQIIIAQADRTKFLKYSKLGDTFFMKDKYDLSLLNYKEALSYFDRSPAVKNKIGVIFKLKGKMDEAEKYFRAALAEQYDFIPAFVNLGSVLYDKGEYENAIIELKKALLITSSDFNVHYNMGLSYEKLGKIEEALASFRKAIYINGSFPDPYIQMAMIYKDKGENKNAIEALRKARELVKEDYDMSTTIDKLIESLN